LNITAIFSQRGNARFGMRPGKRDAALTKY
jgi:hypothetical protein